MTGDRGRGAEDGGLEALTLPSHSDEWGGREGSVMKILYRFFEYVLVFYLFLNFQDNAS